LPIAVGYLLANGDVDFNSDKKIFIGELSLDGSLKKVNGVLAMVKKAKNDGFTSIYLPKENATEASLISDINIFPVKELFDLVEHLNQENKKEKKFK